MKKHFKVLPGAEINMGMDFTGMVLEQYGDNWLLDPRLTGCNCYVLKQPAQDANGRRCAVGGSVSIGAEHLEEVQV